MITLSASWAPKLLSQGETGMGYQVASVILNDRRCFHQVVIVEGNITQIRAIRGIPFSEEEIAEILVTHDKWDFNAER